MHVKPRISASAQSGPAEKLVSWGCRLGVAIPFKIITGRLNLFRNYHAPRKHYLPPKKYYRIIFRLLFHDFDFFELISAKITRFQFSWK